MTNIRAEKSSLRTKIPEAGDIVWVVLDPVLGTEQAGRRPALMLTDSGYNSRNPRSVICPISRNPVSWPTKVALPSTMKTRGAVLADQPRTLHREGRSFRFIEKAPDEVLLAVRAILGELLQISG